MGKFEENLERNENISPEFKELAKQSFQEVFDMLGREGLKKWVKMQTISKDVKSLIYKWADSEEMGGNTVSGDYNSTLNRIRISQGLNSRKAILGVVKHEGLHFFSRKGYLQRRATYLDEGVTEYLKYLSEKTDEGYTYKENVEVVQFLRGLIGDSIIQTYLTGKEKYFFNDLQSILSEDIKNEMEREDAIEEFIDCLENRHDELCAKQERLANLFSGYETENDYLESEESYEENAQKINEFLEKIILCKFKQMAKSREFNRNGRLDEELAKTIIKEKLKNARFVGAEYDFMDNKEDISNHITEIMMDKTLYEIKENCNPKVKINFYWEDVKVLLPKLYSVKDIYSMIFNSKENVSKITFYDYLIKISSEISLPQSEMKELCGKYGVEKIYEIITNNIPRNLGVFNLLSREYTSTESHFRKVGDSEYVEQRDGKFVYLKINDDGTIQEEADLSKVKDIFKIGDTLESIRLINQEDDYRELGVMNEQQFQYAEMVHQMIQSILYQKDVDLENIVKDMNVVIEDAQFLSKITKTALQKRTRLQVMNWINTLTKEELEQVAGEIYDEAVMNSGIRDIEQKEELEEYYNRLYDYEHKNSGR